MWVQQCDEASRFGYRDFLLYDPGDGTWWGFERWAPQAGRIIHWWIASTLSKGQSGHWLPATREQQVVTGEIYEETNAAANQTWCYIGQDPERFMMEVML